MVEDTFQIPTLTEKISKKDVKNSPFVMTICSGKGGVGKSILTANIANIAAKKKLKVLIWDANMNFPNQHLLFGVEPPVRMAEVYSQRISIDSAFFSINPNLSLLADISGSGELDRYPGNIILKIYEDLINISNFDLILIDSAAGIGEQVLQCSAISDLVSIVVTDEPTSLLDGYGLVKLLTKSIDRTKLNLIINNVIDFEDAEDISSKMNLATEKFLKLKLDTLGYVPYDRLVRYSIIHQELFTDSEMNSEVSKAIVDITDNLIDKINVRCLV